MPEGQQSMGVFTKERETSNFWRYQHENEMGHKETIYVPKRVVTELGDPDSIELFVQPA